MFIDFKKAFDHNLLIKKKWAQYYYPNFLYYISMIFTMFLLLKFILFADDTNIFCSGKDIGKLCETVNIELKKLQSWFIVDRLSLNIAKTNYTLFGRQKINTKVNIQLKNIDVERVYVTKFLGVLIDHELNWKEHIKLVSSKLSKIIAMIYNTLSVVFGFTPARIP